MERPDVSPAIELAQSIQKYTQALPHRELAQKLTNAREALAQFDLRRSALREAHTEAVSLVREREAAHHVERPDLLPIEDERYRALKEAERKSRQQLLAFSEEEEKLRRLVATLTAEQQARGSRLEQEVTRRCYANWQGMAQTCISSARKSLAEAIIAYCYAHTSRAEPVDAGNFLETVIDRGEVHRLVTEMVNAERTKVRKEIVKRDEMLG